MELNPDKSFKAYSDNQLLFLGSPSLYFLSGQVRMYTGSQRRLHLLHVHTETIPRVTQEIAGVTT